MNATAEIAVETCRSVERNASAWKFVKLADVAEIVMGQAPRGDQTNFDGLGIVFVKAGEFGSLRPIIREWTTNPLKLAKAGDVLICVVGATCGKLNLAIDCAIGRSVAAIRPSHYTFDRFIHFQLMPKVLALRAGSSGSAQGVLSKDVLGNIDIVLPTIDEQQRIVAEIEKQFTRLDAGVASLTSVQIALKRYRASVLKAACEGRLVPTEAALAREENRRYETGEQLLQRILKAQREKWSGRGKYKEPVAPNTVDLPTLPEGWTWATMPQLGELNRGKSKHRPRDDVKLYGGPYPFVQTGDIRKSGGTISVHHQTYSEVGLRQSRLWPAGTLCITIAANIAETGILTYPACFPDSVVGFLQERLPIVTRYVEFFLRTSKQRIASFAPATAQKNINLEVLRKVAVPLPPLQEQERIVAELDRRISVIEELETVCSTELQRASRLRQSVLNLSFRPANRTT